MNTRKNKHKNRKKRDKNGKNKSKNNFSELQLKILEVMEKEKIMSIYDLSKNLEKPKTTIWDSIFNNKINLRKYIAIVTKHQTKIGRPKTFLVIIGEV